MSSVNQYDHTGEVRAVLQTATIVGLVLLGIILLLCAVVMVMARNAISALFKAFLSSVRGCFWPRVNDSDRDIPLDNLVNRGQRPTTHVRWVNSGELSEGSQQRHGQHRPANRHGHQNSHDQYGRDRGYNRGSRHPADAVREYHRVRGHHISNESADTLPQYEGEVPPVYYADSQV